MTKVAETKVCKKCGVEKEIDEFVVRSDSATRRRRTSCRECHRATQRQAYYDNHDANIRKLRSDEHFGKHLRKKFGITLDEYNRIKFLQGGVCAICGSPPSITDGRFKRKRRLHVDHDHETGKVRGLLCHHCNIALGSFRDDPERLAKAIEYLNHHASKE